MLLLAGCFGLAWVQEPAFYRSQPGDGTVAMLPVEPVPDRVIPDFAAITDTDARKEMFFSFLRPYIDQVNAEMLYLRARVEELAGKRATVGRLSQQERDEVMSLSERFEVQPQAAFSSGHFSQLLRRIDVLPASLVLAQAANESAWGTSRFVQEGNSFFGQWCYSEGCGIIPSRRRSGAYHEVQAFPTVADSVRAYFMNLNTFPTYRKLRVIRQELREKGEVIDGISLSEGLDSYSERGQDYIDELQSMIDFNDLDQYDVLPQA